MKIFEQMRKLNIKFEHPTGLFAVTNENLVLCSEKKERKQRKEDIKVI